MRVRTVVFLATLATPSVATAHSRLVTPPSRSEDDFLMEGPCGGVAPGEPTAYEAGSTLPMEWATTQNHFNVFRVAFSPGDDLGFDDNVLGTRPDEVDVFAYAQDVPLPACTCDSCTLQLAQFTATGNLAYYSCADIRLTAPEGEAMDPCPIADEPTPPGTSTGRGTTGDSAESTAANPGGDDTSLSEGASEESGPTPRGSGSDDSGAATEPSRGCRLVPGARSVWANAVFLGLLLPALRRRRR